MHQNDNPTAGEARTMDGIPTLPGETWRPVVGFEGFYEVSDMDRIRRIPRSGVDARNRPRFRPGGLLKPSPDEHGRMMVTLSAKDERGRRETKIRMHRIVMAAFRGPCPDGMEVCHNNGNASDNRLSNLRYDTPSGNQRDRVAHGTSNRGERHAQVKLTEQQVRDIRDAVAAGASQASQVRKYGVHAVTVSTIVRRVNWAWLD